MSRVDTSPQLPRSIFVKIAALTTFSAVAIFATAGASSTLRQAQSQGAAAAPPHYEYEVVSVKPNTDAGRFGSTNIPDGLSIRGTTLTALIFSAFGLRDPQQLDGAPGWISSERFDVDAKMDPSVMDALQKMTQEDRSAARRQMMQALLADRFKLLVHRETRELAVYTLLVAKGGVKMKEAKPGDTYSNGFKIPGGRGGGAGAMLFQIAPSGVMMTAQGEPLLQLIPTISREGGRIVLDKTGLTGNYDFIFQYTPENFHPRADLAETASSSGLTLPPDFGAISIFTAVQEQLGLKLEAGKAPIDVVVISHVERPSGN